jgi:DsbC/DsbD-like thiol-disulfide interchange protein
MTDHIPCRAVLRRALNRLAILGALVAAALAGPSSVSAQSGPGAEVVAVDVLPGWREPDGTHYAGLRIRLAPGWKTYWRSPGDGGIPPQVDLGRSANLARMTLHLPRPTVFDEAGLRSIGYKGEVVFPLALVAAEAQAPIILEGRMFIGVCKDICIPAEVRLQGTLGAPGQSSALIAAALGAQPTVLAGPMTCEVSPTAEGLLLRAEVQAPGHAGEVAVIELANPALWVSPAQTGREGGRLVAETEILVDGTAPVSLDRSKVRLTVLSSGAAYEITGCVAP